MNDKGVADWAFEMPNGVNYHFHQHSNHQSHTIPHTVQPTIQPPILE
jgi:hypothetical protein